MNITSNIIRELKVLSNQKKREVFKRFFKTGKGEYGEGDSFLGIVIPEIRGVAKRYAKEISLEEVKPLLSNPIHEVRLTGYLILTYKFEKASEEEKKDIYTFYLENLEGVNNWDIVDLSCYKIIGEYLIEHPKERKILYKLADSDVLWEQRISIVSTMSLIKRDGFDDILKISKGLLNHKHDLIHKAIGWMLREVGKREMDVLREFLDENIHSMPRTALRYSIERMEEKERKRYLNM